MKLFSNILMLAVCMAMFAACDTEQPAPSDEGLVAVELSLDAVELTRAFSNGQPVDIDRVLLLPFVKEGSAGTDADFRFDQNLAIQVDVASFPTPEIIMHLSGGNPYKIVALGYKSADYDWSTKSGKFAIGGYSLEDTGFWIPDATQAPVVYMDVCSVNSAEEFVAANALQIEGTLMRMVAGVSLSLTAIPDFVTGIDLVATGDLTTSIMLTGTPAGTQSPGDDLSRTLATLSPVRGASPDTGTVDFNGYILPSSANLGYQLVVHLGISSTQTYTVMAGGATTFPVLANQASNLSGDYTTAINFGFVMGTGGAINLDDPAWDGIN